MPHTLWRLAPEQHAGSAFSGEGAKHFGGRWNRPGVPMVYTSETLALAVLETLVHLQPEDLGQGYVFFRVDVPDEVALPTATWALPSDWRREPPPASIQDVGSDWAQGNTSALLRVPSAVIPQGNRNPSTFQCPENPCASSDNGDMNSGHFRPDPVCSQYRNAQAFSER